MKARLLGVLCVLAATCLASPCSATMIDIDNPDFDDGTAGWSQFGTSGVWAGDSTLEPYSSDSYMAYINGDGLLGQPLEIGGNPLIAYAGDQISISLFEGLRSNQTADDDLEIELRTAYAGATFASQTFGDATLGGWVERDFSYTLTSADAGAEGTEVFLWLANPNSAGASRGGQCLGVLHSCLCDDSRAERAGPLGHRPDWPFGLRLAKAKIAAKEKNRRRRGGSRRNCMVLGCGFFAPAPLL